MMRDYNLTQFIPPPSPDIFLEFIPTYFNNCRDAFGKIEAVSGKWNFEDLLPGLSDFDTRFVYTNDMTAENWLEMSMAIGNVHLEALLRRPDWARILEHLPGINLTWNELLEEQNYYPEYHQWTFYGSTNQLQLQKALSKLKSRPWDIKDEFYNLNRFLTFYGPYNRTIDPGVNVGMYQNKYALHSRFMHYFTPAVQSAVSILEQRTVRGKLESLRLAAKMFPSRTLFEVIIESAMKSYEVPELYGEPAFTKLETEMFDTLKFLSQQLVDRITTVDKPEKTDVTQWKASLNRITIDPSVIVFDTTKFARQMKGRLYFYLNSPASFETEWLFREQIDFVRNFFRVPFRVYWNLMSREQVDNPADILDALPTGIFTSEEIDASRHISKLTASESKIGTCKETARKIFEVYDGFFYAIFKISEEVKMISA